MKEFSFSSQIHKLAKLIKLNKDKKKFLENAMKEINPALFYDLWKDSFETEGYKLKAEYVKHFNKEKILSQKEMGNLLCELLEG